MSPRKRKPPAAGREGLSWRDDPAPTPVPRPGWDEPLRYGWIAQSFDGSLVFRAIVIDARYFAMADARAEDEDPAALLSRFVKNRYQGGWSQAPIACYATKREAVLALRLERQRVYAERLALLDAAITAQS